MFLFEIIFSRYGPYKLNSFLEKNMRISSDLSFQSEMVSEKYKNGRSLDSIIFVK